jgi:hypothetical protein
MVDEVRAVWRRIEPEFRHFTSPRQVRPAGTTLLAPSAKNRRPAPWLAVFSEDDKKKAEGKAERSPLCRSGSYRSGVFRSLAPHHLPR